MTTLLDTYHRNINYMRISITDRCNMRCIYCNSHLAPHLNHDDILRYKEIQKIVKAAARLGVKNLRITGGEPLVRPDVGALIELLYLIEGINDISLTTNGVFLEKYLDELQEAGLKRVNISLDSFNTDKFKYITGGGNLDDVMRGIEASIEAGLDPVKINMVPIKGINDDEIIDFAKKSITHGWNVRYIEYMPFADSPEDKKKLIAIDEIKNMIVNSLGKLEPCGVASGNGPAKYYKLDNSKGTVGFIGAMTHNFCSECNRFRLTADGRLMPCLLRDDEIDIKGPLRAGAGIEELEEVIKKAVAIKQEKHPESDEMDLKKRQMWQIGG
ncbi:MAG TPA: GTP 3',8-cyclase MoaA [Dehalococcoidia bacterium]|nr:GTP 3',8-cyclase MoaA [Dehalococcoidia bacterium]